MADCTQNTEVPTLVALDIAKKAHDAMIAYPNGKTVSMKVPNHLDGYWHFLKQARQHGETLHVAFEPTADYHRNIAFWLQEQGCKCFLVSSLSCARAREMLFNNWDKNDRRDTGVILYLLQQGLMKPFYDPLVAGTFDIQEIANNYHQISLARTRAMNSLFNHYVTLYFPEIERFFYSSRAEWFCQLLLKFPTPRSITRYREDTFVRRAWKVVGRKVSKDKLLRQIYRCAQNSIGLPVTLDSFALSTFRLQVQRFLDLSEQRKRLELTADKFLSERADYHQLRSIPGVGPIVALIIIAESGDLRRFRHYRQYLNFCGFNLAAHQSGSQKGSYRLSKRGNARLRYGFWLAATVAIRKRENSLQPNIVATSKKTPITRMYVARAERPSLPRSLESLMRWSKPTPPTKVIMKSVTRHSSDGPLGRFATR